MFSGSMPIRAGSIRRCVYAGAGASSNRSNSAASMTDCGLMGHWCTQRPSLHSKRPLGAPRRFIHVAAIGPLPRALVGTKAARGSMEASMCCPTPVRSRATSAAVIANVPW